MISSKYRLLFILFLQLQMNNPFVKASYNLRTLDSQNGLSNSAVLCMHQDKFGFMWFGTYDGLNLFDGNNVVVYRQSFENKYGLSSNIIHHITDADDNCLWISTYLGVNKFSLRQRKVSETYPQYRDQCFLASNAEGRLTWLVGNKDYISYYDTDKHCFTELPLKGIDPAEIESFFLDERSVLWVFTNRNKILNITSNYPAEKEISKIRVHVKSVTIHDLKIDYSFYEDGLIYFVDKSGKLYVYTIIGKKKEFIRDISPLIKSYGTISSVISYKKDILIAFKSNGTLKLVATQQYKSEIIDINIGVFDLYKCKDQDVVWIGSDGKGAMMYYKDPEMFGSIMLSKLPIPISKPVRSIYTDKYNNLWFGTKGDGVVCVRNYDKVQKERIPLSNLSYFTTGSGLSNNQVFALLGSKYRNILWMGTEGPGLSYYSYVRNRVYSVINNTGIPIKSVHSIYEENDSTLWMTTGGKGLLKIIIEGCSWTIRVKSAHYFVFKKGNCISNEFFSMAHNDNSILWIGSRGGYGVIRFNTKTNEYKFISLNDENVSAINDILCVHMSNDSTFYLGSSAGLTKMQYHSDGHFFAKNVNGKSIFFNNMIHGILEDDSKCIWLSTNKGLIKYNPQNNFFHCYSCREGLGVIEFSDDAYYRCPYTGKLFFGGINGLSWVEPGVINHIASSPKVLFTGLTVLGEKKNIYDYYAGNDHHIELPSTMNSFSVFFAVPDYINAPSLEYTYFLENHSTEWINIGNTSEVSFVGLPPGHYILKVKYKNDVFDSEDNFFSLPITILAPWYLTTQAQLIYAFLSGLVCLYILFLLNKRVRRKQQALANKLQEQKRTEVYDAKLKFFTNITHEFCTPLTLIHGLCERILSYNQSDEYIKKYASVLLNNSNHLNQLIQEILDFRRLEEGNIISCQIEKVSVSDLMADHILSFTEVAESNKITLDVSVPDQLFWHTDISSFNKILINLISNAFKYTREGGSIKVTLAVDADNLVLDVYNTGEGIAKEKLDLIFNQFLILDNMDKNAYRDIASRNGLGLAICANMVKLLKGRIEVRSEVGKYAAFTVFLPLLPLSEASVGIIHQNNIGEDVKTAGSIPDEQYDHFSFKPSIFIVDDNKDIVWMISEILSDDYNILKAYNAAEAFDILEKQTPNLIITDIMMPGTDGFELAKQIRMNKYTRHIPLIIVSARNTEEDQVNGLLSGADAYLIKPFSSLVLKGLIHRLISNVQVLKEHFNSPESAYELSDGMWLHQNDKDFMEKVIQIIKDNIEEESFGPDILADKIGINTRQLYRKFKDVSQLSPSDFIKDFRFSFASKLLITTNLSIQEVIYKVGIMNRSYFYREFSKKYNMTPKEYRKINYVKN